METELYAGIVELLSGDPEAAEPHLRVANDGLERAGIASDLGQATAHLARAVCLQGRLDEAEELAAESAALAGQNPQTAVVAHCARAEILAARGRFEEAVALATRAVDLLQGSDIIVDLANAHATLARVRAAAGDTAGARGAEAEAEQLYERKGATVGVGVAVSLPPSTAGQHIDDPEAVAEPTEERDVPGHGGPTPNRAARVNDLLDAAFVTRDADALARLAAPDIVVVDDRAVVRREYHGLEDWLRWGASVHLDAVSTELLAVRGQRLVMTRVRWTRNDFTGSFLAVNEIDADDLLVRHGLFDEDDLEGAVEALEQWANEGELAEFATQLGLARSLRRANEQGDAGAIEAMVTPDFELIDHRSASLPTMDRAALGRLGPTMRESMGPFVMLATEHLRVTSAGVVDRVVTVTSEGGYQLRAIWMAVLRDGKVAHIEAFDYDDVDAALRRFEELTSPDKRVSESRVDRVRENAAWQSFDRAYAALANGDAQETMAAYSTDMVSEDRRSMVGAAVDLGQHRFNLGEIATTGIALEWAELAVRDERWCLGRVEMTHPDGFAWYFLHLFEIDDEGLITRQVLFDEDALFDAERTLNRWWSETLPEPRRWAVEIGLRARDGSDRRDSGALAEVMAPDFELIDHRSLIGVGSVGSDQVLDQMLPAMADGRQRSFATDVPRLSESVAVTAVTRYEQHGGIDVERREAMVLVHAAGRLARVELFDGPDLDQAIARFDELTATPRASVFAPRTNAATRTVGAVHQALQVGDVDAAMARYADGFEIVDDRSIVREQRHADAQRQSFELMVAAGTTLHARPLAVRGERLLLSELTVSSQNGFTTTMLDLVEVDDEGRVSRAASFDADRFAEAEDLLNEWWMEGEAAPFRDVFEVALAARTASSRKDFDGWSSVFHPDVELVDQRAIVGLGVIPLERGAVASALSRSADEHIWNVDVPRLDANGWVAIAVATEPIDDSWVERRRVVLGIMRDGLITRSEMYDGDDLDRALARYDELLDDWWRDAFTGGGNRASRVNRHLATLLTRRDVDEVMAAFAPDVVFLDRRPTSVAARSDLAGLRRVIESLQVGSTWDPRVQVTRGERLTLDQVTIHLPQDSELSFVQIVEIDDDGLITRVVIADPEQEDELHELLDEWWLEGEGTSTDDLASRASTRFSDAIDRRDLNALAATLSPEVVFRVHRRLSQVSLRGRDAVVDRLSADIQLLGVQHSEVELLGRAGDRRRLERVSVRLDTGFAVDFLTVLETDSDGLIVALDLFDEEDLDQAQGFLYRSQTAEPARVRRNAAVRCTDAMLTALNARGVEAAVALGADHVVMVDGRPSLEANPPDLDWHAAVRSLVPELDQASGVWSGRVLAVRDENWCLGRATIDTDGFAFEYLDVTGVDEAGRITHSGQFAVDDLAGAAAQMDEWWLEGLDDELREVWLAGDAMRRANDAKDADALWATLADDFVYVDHRGVVGVGVHDRDGMLEVLTMFASTVTSVVTDVDRLTTTGALTPVVQADAGFGMEYRFRAVTLVAAGLVTRLEIFDIDDDSAFARFDELNAPTDADESPEPSGREIVAVRTWQRLLAALGAGDADAALACSATEIEYEDRRRIASDATADWEAAVRSVLPGTTPGLDHLVWRPTVLAVRDERWFLGRLEADADGMAAAFLAVAAVDAGGRFDRYTMFDLDDIEAAQALLDEWWLADRPQTEGETFRRIQQLTRANLRRDASDMEHRLTDDFRLVDRRRLVGVGDQDRDGLLDVMRSTPDARSTQHRHAAAERTRTCLPRDGLLPARGRRRPGGRPGVADPAQR